MNDVEMSTSKSTNNQEVLVTHHEETPTTTSYPYDYLVLATGAQLALSDLNGLNEQEGDANWHHFYSTEGALRSQPW